jgi:hypothetical protein
MSAVDYIVIHKDEITAEMLIEVGEIPTVIQYADGSDTVFSFWEFTGTFPKSLEDAGYHKITYLELREFKAGVLDGSITHSRDGLDDGSGGSGGSGTDNQSGYETITDGTTATIEEHKQMVVFDTLILDDGELIIEGTLVIRD